MNDTNDLGPLFVWISSNALDRSRQTLFDNTGVIATDVGVVRSENQDRVAALRVQFRERSFACIALSDGMGGMQDGAACATLTISVLFQSLIRQTFDRSTMDGRGLLSSATLEANLSVFEKWRGRGGSTLSAILVEPERPAWIVNVGDSRIYGFDEDHSKVVRLMAPELFGSTTISFSPAVDTYAFARTALSLLGVHPPNAKPIR